MIPPGSRAFLLSRDLARIAPAAWRASMTSMTGWSGARTTEVRACPVAPLSQPFCRSTVRWCCTPDGPSPITRPMSRTLGP